MKKILPLALAGVCIFAASTPSYRLLTRMGSLKDFHGAMADYSFDAGRSGVHRFYLGKIEGNKLTPAGGYEDTASR